MIKAYSYVRISSDAQVKGDGFRRQIEKSRKYAEKHGLDLDESLLKSGKAESAFKGLNATTGSLGRFLTAIEDGVVEKGSYLLVESLDRLSRQETMKSLALFMRIMEAGLVVVTLIDEKEYRIETATDADLFMMIGIMSRAHDESKTKSVRSGDNWAQKRRTIADKKLTAMAPAWLKLAADGKSFAVVEERAVIVRRIFDEATSGIGMFTITKRLNEERVPTFGQSRGWHQSYINKILCNRAVFGEFQPHHTVDGERVPFGDPILDYYPVIVDQETFFLAQGERHKRRVSGRGRKGPAVTNLFTGLVHCAYCDSRMHFENKGDGPKGGTYLVCDSGYRKHKCEPVRWRYDHFEASFLAFVEELELGALLASKEVASQRTMIESSIASIEGRIETLKQERERAYNLIRRPDFKSEFVETKLGQCEADITVAESQLREKLTQLASLSQTMAKTYGNKDEIKMLVAQIRNRTGDDVYKSRAQIVSRLRSIVSNIAVGADGNMPTKKLAAAYVEKLKSNPPDDPILRELIDDPTVAANFIGVTAFDRMRYFTVVFRDGTNRTVYPSADDPLNFEQQTQGGDGELAWIDSTSTKTPLQLLE